MYLEERLEKAAGDGNSIIEARADTLQLDLDSPEPTKSEKYLQVMTTLEGLGLLSEIDDLDTRSPGGNTHRYIRLSRRVPISQRIALQAALGSDPVRETLAVMATLGLRPQRPELVLFETPDETERVKVWLDADGI